MSDLGRTTGKVFTIVTALLIWFVLSDNLTKPYCEGLHWGKAYVLTWGSSCNWREKCGCCSHFFTWDPAPLVAVNSLALEEGLPQLFWVFFVPFLN